MAARRGDPKAIEALQAPEYPDAVEYLETLVRLLHGRSGVTMNGLAPLSWGTLADYCRLTGERITADDAKALMLLDAVLLAPNVEDVD